VLGFGGDEGFRHHDVLEGLAVGFEFDFVFFEGEFDGCVERDQGFVGGFFLADAVVGGVGADDIFLAEQVDAFFFLFLLGTAGDGVFGDDRAGLGFVPGLGESRG